MSTVWARVLAGWSGVVHLGGCAWWAATADVEPWAAGLHLLGVGVTTALAWQVLRGGGEAWASTQAEKQGRALREAVLDATAALERAKLGLHYSQPYGGLVDRGRLERAEESVLWAKHWLTRAEKALAQWEEAQGLEE